MWKWTKKRTAFCANTCPFNTDPHRTRSSTRIVLNRLISLSALWFFFRRLLYSVLPPSVANELRHKRPVPAKRYDNVTILFSGIVGFNAFCSKHASAEGAIKIVNLLNDLYTRFDILTDTKRNPYVYKVRNIFYDVNHLCINVYLLCFYHKCQFILTYDQCLCCKDRWIIKETHVILKM